MGSKPETTFETLGQQAAAYKTVLQNLPVGVIVADQDGKFLFVNHEAERILGLAAQDVKPTEWTAAFGCYRPDKVTCYPPEQLPLARALLGEEVLDELIFIRNPRQPVGVWIRANSRPYANAAGAICGALVVFSDVTAGRGSLETVNLLSRAVEQTADSVIITDEHGLIQYVNPAFEATTGYSREEASGQTPRILRSGQHDLAFYQKLWKQILRGQPFRGTLVNRKKTGELYWSEQTITPIKNEEGTVTHFVSVLKDITELRQKHEQEVQLHLAREVQQRFYTAPAAVPGLDMAAAAYPAEQTGGDYFDFISLPDNCLAIAIGDVSGHGFGAALVMALTRAYVRSFAAAGLDVGEILTRVNQALVADLEDDRFVTLLLLRLDLRQGALAYASAGHVPGFLLNGSGEVESVLASTGRPLGLFQASKYATAVVSLKPQQMIVLLTDGASEASNLDGSEFGEERVLECVRSLRHESARQIAEGIYRSVVAFAGDQPQEDDITSVVVKLGLTAVPAAAVNVSIPAQTGEARQINL